MCHYTKLNILPFILICHSEFPRGKPWSKASNTVFSEEVKENNYERYIIKLVTTVKNLNLIFLRNSGRQWKSLLDILSKGHGSWGIYIPLIILGGPWGWAFNFPELLPTKNMGRVDSRNQRRPPGKEFQVHAFRRHSNVHNKSSKKKKL